VLIKIFLALWLLSGLAIPAAAQESPGTPAIEPRTGITFPQTLGPLARMGMKKYDLPELGVSYRYAGKPLPIADIYIYDNGLKDLGTGLTQAVRTHFEEVKSEILLLGKSGNYRDVKKVSEGETYLPPGNPRLPALSATFTFSIPPGKGVAYAGVRTSHILLTAYQGQFLKIQFTYPQDQEKEGKKAWQQFLTAFGKVLKGGKALDNQNNRNNDRTSKKINKSGMAGR